MTDTIAITIDSKYHRDQFDDWLAGGKVGYKMKAYHWTAQNSNYGFGWEVEPIEEEIWAGLSKSELNKMMTLIEKCLSQHRNEYTFAL